MNNTLNGVGFFFSRSISAELIYADGDRTVLKYDRDAFKAHPAAAHPGMF